MKLLNRMLRAGEKRTLDSFLQAAEHVNALEEIYEKLDDRELFALTGEFKQRLASGETLADLQPEAFAAVREAAKRAIGQRHYDVQIAAGAALCAGYIIQMRTGEGKTLAATLAAYTQSLAGMGVHVVTVNDYLAERDAEWMGRVYRMLDTSVGVITENSSTRERKTAYQADITYGTNNEFGFDYLRDNTADNPDGTVQRGHAYAIIDEADSILIDEARTPLIIAGTGDTGGRELSLAAHLVRNWQEGVHYTVNRKLKAVGLLDQGVRQAERKLSVDNLYSIEHRNQAAIVANAVRAHAMHQRDRDYVVIDGQIVLVDEHTGRPTAERRYNDGLHQAIEAKENVEVKPENHTVATVTLQNYFRMYRHLSGMTGTAIAVAGELNRVYGTGVVEIPTHRPMIRRDHPDVIFNTKMDKFRAITDEISDARRRGQPVLVGCGSVFDNEILSGMLHERGIPHQVLNAKHDAIEAAVIAQAGVPGAVTVATNMAGRGTDIALGGSVDDLARSIAGEPDGDDAETRRRWLAALEQAEQETAARRAEAIDAGGLYVIGTERAESRRIDDQLRGRAGRQGDRGQSRFFLSLDDPLLERFSKDQVRHLRDRSRFEPDRPLGGRGIAALFDNAQDESERRNAAERRDLLKLDDVVNKQRHRVYQRRAQLLSGEIDTRQLAAAHIESAIRQACDTYLAGWGEDWDLDGLQTFMQSFTPIGEEFDDVCALPANQREWSKDPVCERLTNWALDAYDDRVRLLGDEIAGQVERQLMLEAIDNRWREHLADIDYMREGFGFHGMAQRDPFVQFALHAQELFVTMQEAIAKDLFESLYTTTVTVRHKPRDFISDEPSGETITVNRVGQPVTQVIEDETPAEPDGGNNEAGIAIDRVDIGRWRGGTVRNEGHIARNAPCPCGSGRKYKRCHGRGGSTATFSPTAGDDGQSDREP